MIIFGQTGNTTTGFQALYSNTTGSYNTANGYQALFSNATGSENTAIGFYALRSNTVGYNNTANGVNALRMNTTGYNNTANGVEALYSNTTGFNNTANGSYALHKNTGPILGFATAGTQNTATGSYTLYNNFIGDWNTATGIAALYNNTSGRENTANGGSALYSNTTGNSNTAIGVDALASNVDGHYNTAVGYNAGRYNDASGINATAIGYAAINTQNNQVRLGNTYVTSIVGGVNWTGLSDRRAKKNIHAKVPGLSFINLLQPVTFNIDLDALDEIIKPKDPETNRLIDSLRMARSPEEKEIIAKARASKEKIVYSGFIAQDVEIAAQSLGYDFSGVDAPENDKTPYGLRYAEFVVH